MNPAILILFYIDFLLTGLLPKIFFKKGGKLNLMWWVTAAPFILCILFLALSLMKFWPPVTGYGTSATKFLGLLSIPFGIASIMLISFTLGTHRIPIALWHQKDDAPQHIVTYGAYGKIRHPFYASFLLAFAGALIYCPHWGTLFTMLYGAVLLTLTAMREEKKLLASEFGEEYRQYLERTGRFFPKWSHS